MFVINNRNLKNIKRFCVVVFNLYILNVRFSVFIFCYREHNGFNKI